MLFVVNNAATNAKLTNQALTILSQHGTVAAVDGQPVIIKTRTDFVSSMTDGRTAQELKPTSKSAEEIAALWSAIKAHMNGRKNVAEQPQPLDSIPLIRRKKGGRKTGETLGPQTTPRDEDDAGSEAVRDLTEEPLLTMKPRETVQLTAVHVRVPEQIARGLRLMSVLEGRQAQELAAEAFEALLTAWNPNWRSSVPPRG